MADTKNIERGNCGSNDSCFEKLYIENTLLRICGALFCHDPKQAALRTAEIELNRGDTEKRIVIRPRSKTWSTRTTRTQDFCRAHQEALGLRSTHSKGNFIYST